MTIKQDGLREKTATHECNMTIYSNKSFAPVNRRNTT